MAGHIQYRGRDKNGQDKWLVQIDTGIVDGHRKFRSKMAYGGKEEANKLLAELLAEPQQTFKDKQCLKKIGDQWIALASKRVTKITLLDYIKYYENKIIPELGHRNIAEINLDDIQTLYNKMDATPRAARYTHVVLRAIMKYAMDLELIRKNPCDIIKAPRIVRREMKVLSPDEVKLFLHHAKSDRFGGLFELLVMTGLRPNEAFALRWSDIVDNRIYVQRTLDRYPNKWEWGETKTSRSRRNVPLPPSLQTWLKQHKVKQNEKRLSQGALYHNHDLIFAAENGEPLRQSNVTRKHFKPILIAAGLPDIRLYDLRHTCATLLLLAGINPKIVSERLGHSSVAITLDVYSHVLPNMQQEATDVLARMIY